MSHRIYLIGSLRNPEIPKLGKILREWGHYVFDDWFGAGKIADDEWQAYEQTRGREYRDALYLGKAAKHTFEWDLENMEGCDTAILVLPTGKSGHLEFGYCVGQGKDGILYMPDGPPERWDLMYRYAKDLTYNFDELYDALGGGPPL